MALISKLTAIGDAIREKTGEDKEYTLDEMASEILSISASPVPEYDGKPKVLYAFTANWSYATSNWNQYGREGYTSSWGLAVTRVPAEMNDIVFFYGEDTTKNQQVSIITRIVGNVGTGIPTLRTLGMLDGRATSADVKSFLAEKGLEYSVNTKMIVEF